MRRLLFSLVLVIVLVGLGVFFWARATITQDTVRATLAAELSDALGQPVSIGSISLKIRPRLRVTVTLGNVAIGEPPGVQIASLHVETGFRALLTRRIEHASPRVEGAKIQLPLIPMGRPAGIENKVATISAPIELVSIDEIVLSNLELISGGRTLRGDAEVVPEPGGAITVRRLSLRADDASIEATGRITDLRGPRGELAVKAGELNVDRFLAFFTDLAGVDTSDASSGDIATGESSTAKPDLNLTIDATRAQFRGFTLEGLSGRAHVTDTGVNVALKANRATLADLTLDGLSGDGHVTNTGLNVAINATRAKLADLALHGVSGRAHVTDTGILLKPIAFGAFGGKYEGSLGFQPARSGGAPTFTVNGTISGIDFAAITRSAGSKAEPITGRLSAQLELTGMGADAAAAMRSMRGTARVKIENGVVRNLGLVRAIVIATSMRGAAATIEGASAAASTEAAISRDEPFTTLRATLAVAGRSATTTDLQFAGRNVSLAARGSIALDGRDVNLTGRVQLSDELTAKAGTDLVRFTRENGRITLPVTIKGPADALSVQIDAGELLKRAIRNWAAEELQKAIIKGLSDLLKKPPK